TAEERLIVAMDALYRRQKGGILCEEPGLSPGPLQERGCVSPGTVHGPIIAGLGNDSQLQLPAAPPTPLSEQVTGRFHITTLTEALPAKALHRHGRGHAL